MTTITGTITDSEGNTLNGELVIQLDSPVVETATSPYTLYTTQPSTYTVTSGAINIDLPETANDNVTYRFRFNVIDTETLFYFGDGTLYDGPRHQEGSDWFTGLITNPDQVQIYPIEGDRSIPILDFHAIVPNQSTVDFSDLMPTGVTQNILDTSIRRLVQLITTVPDYVTALRGSPFWQGAYNPATFYGEGDAVSYAGSSWYYINPTPTAGNTPAEGMYWTAIALKGDPGGTGGDDTAYDATGWNGDTNAPSKNAVRDLVEGSLAKLSDLAGYAQLASPAFTGVPTAPTAASGTANGQVASTQFVASNFAALNNPAFTGTPTAPTPVVGDRSIKLATTDFVRDAIDEYVDDRGSRLILAAFRTVASLITNSTANTLITIPYTVETYDPNNAYDNGTSTYNYQNTAIGANPVALKIKVSVPIYHDGTSQKSSIRVFVGGTTYILSYNDQLGWSDGSGGFVFIQTGDVVAYLADASALTSIYCQWFGRRTGGTRTDFAPSTLMNSMFFTIEEIKL